MPLLTLREAKRHLRIDHVDEDDDIDRKIDQASAIIIDYLKYERTGWDDPANVPEHVKSATLLVLSNLFEDRDGTNDGDYLKPGGPVARLLARSRDPAIA